ncbi:hypothetical protein BD289DRAFT_215741 [Coniella lustricola]|uniref:Uncharacterized protein n=1 Tax=Coniella lustricola TaxID=2025994 RepID=A0A2T2ZS32_9PEZI|nr:hypothetical protein BD289DRAFT_215741 [Coniella lustricola]
MPRGQGPPSSISPTHWGCHPKLDPSTRFLDSSSPPHSTVARVHLSCLSVLVRIILPHNPLCQSLFTICSIIAGSLVFLGALHLCVYLARIYCTVHCRPQSTFPVLCASPCSKKGPLVFIGKQRKYQKPRCNLSKLNPQSTNAAIATGQRQVAASCVLLANSSESSSVQPGHD